MKYLFLLGHIAAWKTLLALSAFAQDAPQYFLSPLYYRGNYGFKSVSDNRTVTSIAQERASSQLTGDILRLHTTGAFSDSPYSVVTTNRIPMSLIGNYNALINVGLLRYRTPTTAAGHTLLSVGNMNTVGNVTYYGGGAIWKADNTVDLFRPPTLATGLILLDMNEGLDVVGNILYEYVDRFGRTQVRPEPVRITSSGATTMIHPSRMERYGFETEPHPDGPTLRPIVVLDNGAQAVAINNQGMIACDAYGLTWHEGSERWIKEEWSFVATRIGIPIVENLPQGATDINDLGEVVGYNRFSGTWLYLPNGNYGLDSGVHIISPLIYKDSEGHTTRHEITVLINNRGDVVWRGEKQLAANDPTYPVRIWRMGRVHYLNNLYTTAENFSIITTLDLNEKGDILVSTDEQYDWGGTTGVRRTFGYRLLSLAPFETELIVNVADDVSDADPDDGVIDTDLETAGLQVSLRAAIDAVNAGDSDSIKFDLPGSSAPTLILTKALPAITRPVTIDGTSQSAGMVEIRGGANAGAGFHLQGGESEIRGMVMHGFTGRDAAAIRISGPGGNKIVGNRLGTDAAGNMVAKTQFGVLIEGSPDNQIGGDENGDQNILYGETAGIRIMGMGANGNQVLGNRIGIGADGTILNPLAGSGIEINQGDNIMIGGSGNTANLIAGASAIAVGGDASISGLEIIGNRIGLNGAGDESSGGFFGIGLVGGGASSITNVKITRNKISGHLANVILLGTENGVRNVDILENEIGLRFDDPGTVPAGLSNGVQEYGVRIEGAADIDLSDNVIAGHAWNVLVSGIPQLFVTGGYDTDGDGVKDSDFNIDLLNPSRGLVPDEDETPSRGVTIERNFIGLNREEAVPTGFVQFNGLSNYGAARDTRIEDNIIGGNTENGLWIQNGLGVVVHGNRIGVTTSGNPVPNKQGVFVEEGEVAMTGNIVAQNTNVGIKATGEAGALSILGGSIYQNGTGQGEAGILYASKPFSPPQQVIVLRTPSETDGMITITFAVPTIIKVSDTEEPQTTLQIWGNPDNTETQGRTLLVNEVVNPGNPFTKKLEVEIDSIFATSRNYTATLTRGNHTSGFSPGSTAQNIVWPELNFTPDAEPGEITFEWPVSDSVGAFIVEESPTLEGPWYRRAVDPIRNGNNMEVSLPVGDGDQYFRLVLNPDAMVQQ